MMKVVVKKVPKKKKVVIIPATTEYSIIGLTKEQASHLASIMLHEREWEDYEGDPSLMKDIYKGLTRIK